MDFLPIKHMRQRVYKHVAVALEPKKTSLTQIEIWMDENNNQTVVVLECDEDDDDDADAWPIFHASSVSIKLSRLRQ